jgi:hypothetical protein
LSFLKAIICPLLLAFLICLQVLAVDQVIPAEKMLSLDEVAKNFSDQTELVKKFNLILKEQSPSGADLRLATFLFVLKSSYIAPESKFPQISRKSKKAFEKVFQMREDLKGIADSYQAEFDRFLDTSSDDLSRERTLLGITRFLEFFGDASLLNKYMTQLIEVRIKLGLFDDAATTAGEWLMLSKQNLNGKVKALIYKGEIGIAVGRPNMTASTLEKLKFLVSADELSSLIFEGAILFQRGKFKECIAHGQGQLLRKDKRSIANYERYKSLIALCQLASNQVAAAAATIEQPEESAKSEPSLLKQLILVRQGKAADALELCKSSSSKDGGMTYYRKIQKYSSCIFWGEDAAFLKQMHSEVEAIDPAYQVLAKRSKRIEGLVELIDAKKSGLSEKINKAKMSVVLAFGKNSLWGLLMSSKSI